MAAHPSGSNVKPQSGEKIIRFINFFTIITATIVGLALPSLYFIEDAVGEADEIKELAQIQVREITQTLKKDSTLWPLNTQRLTALLEEHVADGDKDETHHSILDVNGNLIVTSATPSLTKPTVSEVLAVHDAAGHVGYYKIERSLESLVKETVYVAILGLLLALLIAFPLRLLPIRALRQAFRDLEHEKDKALIPLASIADAVVMTDEQTLVEYLNPRAEQLTGWTTAQAKGVRLDRVFNIVDEINREPARHPIGECLATNTPIEPDNQPILTRRTDKKEFYIENSAAPIRETDGTIVGAVMVFRDVTDKKLAQDRLHHIAFHDALTELPNRALFQKRLLQAMESARSRNKHVAVLFMDLDRFKVINDSLGHIIGDELLVLVSKRLRHCLREDDVVSRLGGDEFTAVLKDLNFADNAGLIAEKILHELSRPFNIQGQELHVSVSIGITVYPQDGDNIDALLKNADTAMYHAKVNGRNNFQYFAASMSARAMETLRLLNALHMALENNEYFLAYQPKLNLKANQITGVEALLRWQSLKLGLVMPGEFIPVLEESGQILSVGRWVLKTAILQAKQWMDLGYPLVVSVNMSVRQFAQGDLVDEVAHMLNSAGLPAELLQIEVTESLFMEDADRNASIIERLTELGVSISLDDFGTGYSSLSYLRRFSIAELKIDRSFIVEIGSNETACKVVKTIIDLGQALHMTVTAEGVETHEQSAQLLKMGCDEVQGYLLSKPVGAAELEALLQHYRDNHTFRVSGGASPMPHGSAIQNSVLIRE